MKRLFTNKYKLRILNKLSELVSLQAEMTAEQNKHRQHLNPKEYCAWDYRIHEVKSDIELLNSLL